MNKDLSHMMPGGGVQEGKNADKFICGHEVGINISFADLEKHLPLALLFSFKLLSQLNITALFA